EVFGRTAASLGGRLLDSAAQSAYDAAFAARQPYDDLAYVPPTKDGSRKILSISARPVFDAQGRFAGYRGTATDITEREKWRSVIAQISGRVGNVVGTDFLKALIATLTEALGAVHAIVGVYEDEGKTLRTIVRYAGGRFV